jgi:hypothetical protein
LNPLERRRKNDLRVSRRYMRKWLLAIGYSHAEPIPWR